MSYAKDVFIKNRILIVGSLLSMIGILTIANGYPVVDMLIISSLIVLLAFATALSPLLIGLAFVIFEGLFLFYFTQDFFLPISQISPIDSSYQTYWYAGIALTLCSFVALPLASIAIYKYGNGRLWINILILITILNSAIFLSIFINDSLLVFMSIVFGFLLGIIVVMLRSLYLRKKYYAQNNVTEYKNKNVLFKKYQSDSEILKETQFGVECKNAAGEEFLVHILPKNASLGIDKKYIYINNKYIYNNNIEKMLRYADSKKQRLLLVQEKDLPQIQELKFYSPLQPDKLLGYVYVMGVNNMRKATA